MGRKPKVFKEDILNASFEILKEKGFEYFTARRVAKKLGSSTQPIYKEFNGMDQLKESLIECIKEFMHEEIFQVHEEKRSVVEVCLNYIRFAKDETVFFTSLFLDQSLDVLPLHDYSYEILSDVLDQDQEFSNETYSNKEHVLDLIWPSIHGMAILVAQEKLNWDKEKLTKNINHIVKTSQEVG